MWVYLSADPVIQENHAYALDCSRATTRGIRTTSIKSIHIAVLDASLFI
jgi:hypothetical protein